MKCRFYFGTIPKQIGFSASVFGVTGVLIAMGSALGAMFNRRLLTRHSGDQLILQGCWLGGTGCAIAVDGYAFSAVRAICGAVAGYCSHGSDGHCFWSYCSQFAQFCTVGIQG